MAIAHDAVTESAPFTTTPDPFTFNHTPVGTPRGVLVMIAHGAVSTDLITSVSYGGVSMTRIATAADTVGEQGRVYAYFLGSNISSGTQIVSIDHTATSTVKIATAMTMTAAADTVVDSYNILSADTANPQIILNSGANTAIRYCVIYSGLGLPSNLGMLGGMTALHSHDYGAFVERVDRQTNPSSGSMTMGYTSTIDDVAMVAIAFREVINAEINAEPTSYALTGLNAGQIKDSLINSEIGMLTLTGIDTGLPASYMIDAQLTSYVMTGMQQTYTVYVPGLFGSTHMDNRNLSYRYFGQRVLS